MCEECAVQPDNMCVQQVSVCTKPIRCVRCTKAVLRNASERDKNPSLNKFCQGDPHQRSPNAPKFKVRSQEETKWQEHWAREAPWRLSKKILKLKEKHKAAFFSSTEKWCLPSSSKIKTGGRRVCGRLPGVDAHDKQKGS